MTMISRDELATLQSLAGDTEAFADALAMLGLPVEPLVDGVTKRAREIVATELGWDNDDSFVDDISEMRTARAAIEADLAIVERVRERARGGSLHFASGFAAACDAITEAMKGEA